MKVRPYPLVLACTLAHGAICQDDAPDPGGFHLMRVENEYKIMVPDSQADALWDWMVLEFGPQNLFLKTYDSTFTSRTATDLMVDQYFDNDRMDLLNSGNGVRHRMRKVLTDTTDRKHGRELVQVKINRIDDNTLNRGEFKFKVDPVRSDTIGGAPVERHPFLGRVAPLHRPAVMAKLKEYGVGGDSLYPTILLEQLRRRIYLARNGKPFATLTLDGVTARYEGRSYHSTELELELNEIGYTEGDPDFRAEMEMLNGLIKDRVMKDWPMLRQDQTPKYKKAFLGLGLERFTSPYGKHHGRARGLIGGGLTVVAIALALYFRARKRRALHGGS